MKVGFHARRASAPSDSKTSAVLAAPSINIFGFEQNSGAWFQLHQAWLSFSVRRALRQPIAISMSTDSDVKRLFRDIEAEILEQTDVLLRAVR